MDFNPSRLILNNHLVHVLSHSLAVRTYWPHILVFHRLYFFSCIPLLIILYLVTINRKGNRFRFDVSFRSLYLHQDIGPGSQRLIRLQISHTLFFRLCASVLFRHLTVTDGCIGFEYADLRPGIVPHENLLALIIQRDSIFIKQDISAACHSCCPVSGNIALCGINLEQGSIVQDILPGFGIQFFNPQSGTVELIFKVFVGKSDKVKTAILQTGIPVSYIPVVIDDFPVSGVQDTPGD